MIDRLVARLQQERGAVATVALLLGDAARFAAPLRQGGWDVRLAAPGTTFGVPAGSCDVVVAENVVSRDPWDRWALQRMHAALRTGGTLLLEEPNQLDLATPGGVLYVAVRGVREVYRRLRRALRVPGVAGPSLAGRKPSSATLDAMLGPLRFERRDGGFDRSGGWAAVLPAKYAPRLWRQAVTLPAVAGLADAWPEAAGHCEAYERAQAHLFATLARWRSEHAKWTVPAPASFDAGDFAGRTVLVLAPHPDDEVIGAGGALVQLVRAGARVVCVQATDGSLGAALAGLPEAERREVRLREAAAVGKRIGFAAIEFWRADNAALRMTDELLGRMRELLERERPALVLLPFVTEAHADHVTLCAIFARALQGLAVPLDALVLGYEVWSLLPPTHVHDITPVMGELEALLFLYDQAMRVDDFVHFCADRALRHGYRLQGRPAYLEVFHGVSAADYPALLDTVTRAHRG
jgi:LmbE family N-acetylglucosaminyl deacetylase/SAM-dependent methyltransferase